MATNVISTNFSLRLNNSPTASPQLVAESKVATLSTGELFYTSTFTVDQIGVYLGIVNDFLAVQVKSPINIWFKRSQDMQDYQAIYCSKLFINHGDMGQVILSVPDGVAPVVATVWYSSNDQIINRSLYINVNYKQKVVKKLSLRNLSSQVRDIPIKVNNIGTKYVGLNTLVVTSNIGVKTDVIKVYKHNVPTDGVPSCYLKVFSENIATSNVSSTTLPTG